MSSSRARATVVLKFTAIALCGCLLAYTTGRPLGAQEAAAEAAVEEDSGAGLFTTASGEPLDKVLERIYLSGYARVRPEFTSDFGDFNSDLDDDFGFVSARLRLGVGVDVIHNISFFVEGQNNSFWGDFSTGGNFDPTQEDDFSLYQGFVEVRDIAGSKFAVKVGRQELVYGTELLLGDADFGPGLSHDAVKVMYEGEVGQVHAWWSRLVEGNVATFPLPAGSLPSPAGDNDADFFGIYGMCTPWENTDVDAYYLFLNDGVSGVNPFLLPAGSAAEDQIHTFGLRGSHALTDMIAFNAEAAYQLGDSLVGGVGGTELDVNAWAVETDVTLNLEKYAEGLKPSVKVGYAFATGDADPTDGDSNAFRPLFQDNHPRLGLSDLLVLSNLHALSATLTTQPHENVGVGVGFYSFWVDRTESAASSIPSPGTGTDNHLLGHEINLFVDLTYTEFLSAQFAWAHFIPGEFVGDSLGALSDADRLYFHLVFSF
ncbi:MAG: alginate export family protein [Planctomycetota bacterium]|nr:alginate export family protein [Planctomycetota bacterium]